MGRRDVLCVAIKPDGATCRRVMQFVRDSDSAAGRHYVFRCPYCAALRVVHENYTEKLS